MNAVEIEEAISQLAEQPFDAAEFPYAFLLAFGNKDTTIKRLRAGSSNKSDLGGVLQASNIHIKTCAEGEATATLRALRDSPATTRAKAKFILATDGVEFQAEDLTSGEAIIYPYADFPNHFGFFLPLAGITTVRAIRENAFDIKATGRLNRLYIELLKDNPEWGTATRRHEMNQFMARLIFCFFAEDTGIFAQETIFTRTIDTMSARDSSNTHEVIGELFRAMNTKPDDRAAEGIPRWADPFPYVNGELFSGTTEAPRFSRIARSYLLTIGGLDWTQVNPDIFGSMIQAVADEEERGALGMHYTSVPNILKVLNPLFLDDLRAALEEAGDNGRKLLNLRSRMAKIRVFDPACGSGNFLVIAYKELRAIEAEINRRRGEADRRSEITLTNFRGIELKDFPATIARLALIIAEYQCDVLHRGQREATRDFLPLDSKNWITCGNALRLDWLSICPPTGTGVKLRGDDLFSTPLDQAEIDFENEGGETYICGNPPYKGSQTQNREQKSDLESVFKPYGISSRQLDYVAGWVMKAAEYGRHTRTASAFVTTNSICQGRIVPILWPEIFATGHQINFAHTSFKWANLAAHNAGVTVAIIGISRQPGALRRLYADEDGETILREVAHINAYLTPGADVIVTRANRPLGELTEMSFGNMPVDGGHLLLSTSEVAELGLTDAQRSRFVRRIYGSAEFIRGLSRHVLWIEDEHLDEAMQVPTIAARIEGVRQMRLASRDGGTNAMAQRAHQMREMNIGRTQTVALPSVSSENREYLPVGLLDANSTVTNLAFALYDAPLWNMALIASRLHLVWIGTVCGKLETRYRYSNTLGWNTFPVPPLTEKQKSDLTACAEAILLAREAHFPATIADLYDPEKMPDNLRAAHDHNDEVLERIYIGRRFRNDTERLEHLFSLYTKMTTKPKAMSGGA
ncbi:class I SAM-dependent DNA methyltransferase [Paracoccus pantotrophus]|uniref:class I SAM-dependent DNA methyltransferase n=1 Tax=Paracoccus pantotrophus TaxID=82367 RepID=UPI000E092D7F|nr:DNA methyltransferase [Paracoccus pantotrophus]RDD99722.1 class I SAM-dependent DNA methyltransferase [Paracoccus pantotrophus]WGR64914.1 class I SAM-dependent DNA methyltransferase [Paracoccus pantotrophus]